MPNGGNSSSSSSNICIRDVWSENLDEEIAVIRNIVDDYPYIAMDTEFPGVVVKPVGDFQTAADFHYQSLKSNVDVLKLIQLGLTFSNAAGDLPQCIWQFNFNFDLSDDPHNMTSIELLKQSGIDFSKNARQGIDSQRFGELLMSSGVVLNEDVHWITFHSRYDFGYLLKILIGKDLPPSEADFLNLLKVYFPVVYDVKYLMKFCNSLHGGLSSLARTLGVERFGNCHQAGSDSLLTLRVFCKLSKQYFNNSVEKYAGVLYGMSPDSGSNNY